MFLLHESGRRGERGRVREDCGMHSYCDHVCRLRVDLREQGLRTLLGSELEGGLPPVPGAGDHVTLTADPILRWLLEGAVLHGRRIG